MPDVVEGLGGFGPTLLIALLVTLRVYGVVIGAFVMRRLGRLPSDGSGVLQRLLIDVLFPALIVSNLLGDERFDDAAELWLPPTVGFAFTTLGFGLGLLVGHVAGGLLGLRTAGQRRAFAVAVGMANYGYLPIPLTEAFVADGLVPATTLPTLFVHNVGVDLALWSIGILIISGGGFSEGVGGVLKRVVNMPLVTILVVLALNLLGVTRESAVAEWVLGLCGFLGAAAIPVALVMTGMAIADVWGESSLLRGGGWRVALGGSVLRLLLLPVLMLTLALSLPAWEQPMRSALAVQAAMPAALFPIVLSRIYGADTATAVRVSVTTAVVAFVTIPLWLALGLTLIG